MAKRFRTVAGRLADALEVSRPSPEEFFSRLVWLDGRPLLATIEPYRQRIFETVLATFDPDGRPHYNLALCGRGKKNWKTFDLVLAALYRFLPWPSAQGNDGFILANDEDQAGDDLALAKKFISVNPVLAREVSLGAKSIARRDNRGTLSVLPSKDAVGAHGKTAIFIAFDEIHGYRTYDLFEALAHDPTRRDVLMWITSYAGIRHAAGIPLYDFMQTGKRGDDPRMFFSWYAGDFTTDPDFAELSPEQRANPSMSAWDSPDYLAQQKKRLPTHKYRRLHLNLPGAPDGAALSADSVISAVVPGRKRLPPARGVTYQAFVDMSGGSSDDAVLGIAHRDATTSKVILDLVEGQSRRPPFNPRHAVKKFAGLLEEYGLRRVTGDAYAGETFRTDFQDHGIAYVVSDRAKSEIYEELEPKLNAGEVELLDVPTMQEQLLTLVWRGTKIDHQPGDHDDFANAAAGAVMLVGSRSRPMVITDEMIAAAAAFNRHSRRHRALS